MIQAFKARKENRLMQIHLEPITPTPQVVQKLMQWHNDPEIQPLLIPNTQGGAPAPLTAPRAFQIAAGKPGERRYVIYDGDVPIGEAALQTGFAQLRGNPHKAGWVSIGIGEKAYWRRGIGTKAMEFLEQKARQMGLLRLELGVFAPNLPARRLYEKMGYQVFATVPRFTFINGAWEDDLRMEKHL